jgi:hypothetical protein
MAQHRLRHQDGVDDVVLALDALLEVLESHRQGYRAQGPAS